MAEPTTRLRLRVLPPRRSRARPSVSVVSGHTSRDKIVELHGLDPRETERRLEKE